MSDTKTCSKCGRLLHLDLFSPHPKSRDKKQAACKECYAKMGRLAYKENPEKHRNAQREYMRGLTAEVCKSRNKIAYIKHKNKQTAWINSNKEHVLELHRKYDTYAKDNLTDRYVKKALLRSATESQDIVEAKREQVRLHRLVVQLQQAIIEVETTEKETP